MAGNKPSKRRHNFHEGVFCMKFIHILVALLILSAGMYFLLSRKKPLSAPGAFLDDIIPELDRFLADFPEVFPAGSYANVSDAFPAGAASRGTGSIVFRKDGSQPWMTVMGQNESRTYFFADESGSATMIGFTLGIVMELNAPACGVRLYEQRSGKSTELETSELLSIAESFKRDYGLV